MTGQIDHGIAISVFYVLAQMFNLRRQRNAVGRYVALLAIAQQVGRGVRQRESANVQVDKDDWRKTGHTISTFL